MNVLGTIIRLQRERERERERERDLRASLEHALINLLTTGNTPVCG